MRELRAISYEEKKRRIEKGTIEVELLEWKLNNDEWIDDERFFSDYQFQ